MPQVIEAIPAGRSHINMVVLIPGLAATQPGRGALADVGGTNNLQNTQFSIHGGRTSDTRLQLDGVRLGNVLSPGEFSNFVPDTSATQEVAVDYAAVSAEQPFGGLRIDIIPREGGNTFRGTVFATGVNSAWQTSNLTDELRNLGLPEPNEMKKAYDINPGVGGPILREKLWFYSSARWQANQNYIAGLYYNKNEGDPTKWLYEQDTSRRGFFSLEQNGINTRLTWQAAQKHKIAFYYDFQSRIWDDTRAGVSPESAVAYRFPVLNLAQASWTTPLTNKLLVEVRYANRGEAFGNQLPAEGSVYRDMVPVLEQSTNFFYRGKGGDGGVSGLFGYSSQKINTLVTSMSYVTGSHAIKVGFSDTWASTVSTTESNSRYMMFRFNTTCALNAGVPAGTACTAANGTLTTLPNQLTMYGVPTRGESLVKGELGFYAQDRWTINRWTITGGIRYDGYRGGYPEQYRGPAPLQPTRNYTFAAVTSMSLHDVTPRLGVAYDLFGTGKTALKAALGKYVIGVSTIGNPAGVSTTTTRNWNDQFFPVGDPRRGNFNPDCDLLNLQQNDECSTVASLTFGQLTSIPEFNEATRFGWGNRAYNWEFSTSVQHELLPRLGIDVGYFRRWFGNFQVTQLRGLTAADFDRYSVTAPLDSRLPDGGGYPIEGLYNVNPTRTGIGTTYTTLARDFGDQSEYWNGVDFSANARLQNGIMLQGGVSTGRTTSDNCDVIGNDQGAVFGGAAPGAGPSLRGCHVQAAFLTQVKLLGTYIIPVIDMNVAATVQSTPGPVLAANRQFTNAEIIPSLGRPLSAQAAERHHQHAASGRHVRRSRQPVRSAAGQDGQVRRTACVGESRHLQPVQRESRDAGERRVRRVADAAAHHGRALVQDQRAVRFLGGGNGGDGGNGINTEKRSNGEFLSQEERVSVSPFLRVNPVGSAISVSLLQRSAHAKVHDDVAARTRCCLLASTLHAQSPHTAHRARLHRDPATGQQVRAGDRHLLEQRLRLRRSVRRRRLLAPEQGGKLGASFRGASGWPKRQAADRAAARTSAGSSRA